MIETTCLRHVGKAVARRMKNPRRPAQLVGAVFGEKILDGGAALGCAQIAARRLAVLIADGQHMMSSSNDVRSAASRALRISSRKRIFGKYCGFCGSKSEGPFSIA